MKTVLLVLQSIASSSLRSSGRSAHAFRRQSSSPAIFDASRTGSAGGAAFIAAAGAFGLAGASAVGGRAGTAGGNNNAPTTMAMCSGNDHHRDTTTAASSSSSSSSSSSTTTHNNGDNRRGGSIFEPEKVAHDPLLPFPETSLRHDTYDGVTLDVTSLLTSSVERHHASVVADATSFGVALGRALEIWTETGRRGIWLKIPTSHSHLIDPACAVHGFDFQHAERGYCVLTRWLPAGGGASRLPDGPTHQVGIGALVIHPVTGKMLAVREKSGPAARAKLWKMPTGLTDPGEDIAAAAVRELKEETGLDCVFDRIVCFRQAHGGLFGRSDMFFVCLCKLAPESERRVREGGDVDLVPQEEEILMAEWIDFEAYAQQGIWKESLLYKEMNAAMLRAAKRGISCSNSGDDDDDDDDDDESHGFVAKNLEVGFRPGRNTIYVSSKL